MAGTKKKIQHPIAHAKGNRSLRGNRYQAENLGEGALAVQGDYNQVQYQHITNVFGDTPPSVEEETELKKLREFIPRTIADLKSAIKQKKPAGGNPYHLLEALSVQEHDQLFGRESVVSHLIAQLENKGFTALAGENGIGKTSLLRAGLVPALVEEGHWPLWIEATSESLDVTIKKGVLGALASFPLLSKHSLKDILQLATAFIPDGKGILLLVDNLEMVFKQPRDQQEEFVKLWKECINQTGLGDRWLFCMAGVTHHLSQFQSGEINPFAGLTILGPLDRDAARQAIVQPAQASHIHLEEALVETLVKELGQDEVDPSRLQIVCHTLAGGSQSIKREISLADYEQAQRVDGLIQNYLSRAINELPLEDRDPSWQVLSILENSEPITGQEIGKKLAQYGIRVGDVDALLDRLQVKHLATNGEEGFHLASQSMRLPIRTWRENEAIPRQIQKEAARQAEQIRNSVLRGLFGGAVGLGLFRWVAGNPILDPTAAVFLTLLYATVGGLFGLLLTFSVDLASIMRTRIMLRYLIGGLGGAIAFGFALALFAYLSTPSENPLLQSLLAGVEGGAWGLVAGMGIAWGMNTSRPAWIVILAVPIASALTLVLAENLLTILSRSTMVQVAGGGFVFPLFIAIGARLGRRAGGSP